MKQIYKSLKLLSCFVLAVTLIVGAQTAVGQTTHTISGIVTDERGEALIGATVIVVGDESRSTATLVDGSYTVRVADPNGSLTFSYIGYESMTMPVNGRTRIDVTLSPDATQLDDIVVIGYGTQRKSDLTGAIETVTSKDFNPGVAGSAEGLIMGKVSGVQITSNSGSPNAGSTIRIRGGASLNASNDPLVVLDGVPLESGGITGNGDNFMSLINPNDIESITILKDASSTAIYGSRASNGVMIINTKKGSKGFNVNLSSTHSLSHVSRTADVLSANEYRDVINTYGTNNHKALLGDASTNWSDEVYRLAYGTDNNVSVSGTVADFMPIRASFGYYNQNGVLLTDNVERITGGVTLSPSFFDNHLKINLNVKGTKNNNRFANDQAVFATAAYNPTIPVMSGSDEYGGYNEALEDGEPKISGQLYNPVGLLKEYDSRSEVSRVIGNLDMDYSMHFLPELRAHMTLGYDWAKGMGSVYQPDYAAQNYLTGGRDYSYGPQKKNNKLLTAYLNYAKDFSSIRSRLDVTAGYDYQNWKATSPAGADKNIAGDVINTYPQTDQRHLLMSFYGRVNYTFADKYMLTATVRHDGTSRLSKDNRWSTFPSVALAWRISEENFLKGSDVLSNLKLRASYGVTGQQDGIGNYGYIPQYTISQSGAYYPFGGEYLYTYRPEAYVEDLKWETTSSYNIGLDFGFFNERLSGSIEYYNRKTKDLLATVPAPAGSTFGRQITKNVGNMKSDGLEFSLNATPVHNKNWRWDISYNFTWQKVRITSLNLVEGASTVSIPAGQTIDGKYLQVMREGYAPFTFYMRKQVYDESGKPIEGLYAILNSESELDRDNYYYANSPNPDFLMGLSTQLTYKNLTLGFSLRASIGNYAYNGLAMNTGAYETVHYNDYQINNLSKSFLDTGFKNRQYFSDYYIENASFLKMDNITLGYNFGNITKWCSLRLTAMVQNVFTITKYSGVDPEIYNGVEGSFYPRARTYSLSLGFDF